jgi:copper chaperone
MIEFRLENMTCGHCAKAVASAIREVDPTAHMEVDLLNKKVKVESATPAHVLAQALAERGYPSA